MNSSRRNFLRTSSLGAAGAALTGCTSRESVAEEPAPFLGIVDIHQHVGYLERPDEQLVAHQELMGVTKTVLLPSGTPVARPSTHDGKSNGLAAKALGNDACRNIVEQHPDHYAWFVNEVPDLPDAQKEFERHLNNGAIGIGEQKFAVDCHSKHIDLVASIAREFDVPVLLHFQHDTYNLNFKEFHKILTKFPSVTFIGHAQTWWGNIDKNHQQPVMYPKGPVTPGGLTDRYLADFPNMFGDLSAGSGQNSLTRDEDHAREFLKRHQDKLLFGSDCPDRFGQGSQCTGSTTLDVLRRLVEDEPTLEKILGRNARRVMRL